MFLVLLCSRRTAYIVRDNANKNYNSRLILQGCNIIFKVFNVFDVVYVKLNSLPCEFSGLHYMALPLQWMRILRKKCSDDDVRTFRQRWVVIVYAYSDEVIAIHKMADCDDLYFLDSPLLKVLLLTEKN